LAHVMKTQWAALAWSDVLMTTLLKWDHYTSSAKNSVNTCYTAESSSASLIPDSLTVDDKFCL
jgi:hypothetical protein